MSIQSFPARLPIPEEVLGIARKLEEAGFETWCVGGAVRDNLLGEANQDFDLATAATPDVVQRLFRRTIPVGVEHGTVAVLDHRQQPHEVTTFRRDVKTDGRHAVVEFGASLDEDLARRDFTINAIAHHPLRHEWRDLFDGRGDLARHVIRAVGDPTRRFQEDYLRILRALRFAARFGFEIEPATWEAAKAGAESLRHLSAERVRAEWFRALGTARRVSEVVDKWTSVGALEIWMPEIRWTDERRETGDERRETSVLERLSEPDPVLITSLLSTDPPATLARLRSSNAEIERGRRIAAHRAARPDAGSEVAVRRWMAVAGEAVDDVVTLWRAREPEYGERLRVAVDAVRRSGAPLTVGQLAVSGHDLQAAGIKPGPTMGKTLRDLLEAALEDPSLNTRERLLELVRRRPAAG